MQEVNQESNGVTPHEVLTAIDELEKGDIEVLYPNSKMEMRDRKATLHGDGKTIKHQKIPMCGHPFFQGHEPKHRNCEPCWFAFFSIHSDLSEAVSKVYTEQGPAFLTAIRGPKFTKHFKRYVETLAKFQRVTEATKESYKKDVTSTGSTEGGNGREARDASTEARS